MLNPSEENNFTWGLSGNTHTHTQKKKKKQEKSQLDLTTTIHSWIWSLISNLSPLGNFFLSTPALWRGSYLRGEVYLFIFFSMKCVCFSQDETFASKHDKTMIETREEWCVMKLPGSYLFNVVRERETKWKKYSFHYFGKLWPSPAFTVGGRQTTCLSSIVWNHTWCIVCKNTKTQPEKKNDAAATKIDMRVHTDKNAKQDVMMQGMWSTSVWPPEIQAVCLKEMSIGKQFLFFCNFMMSRIHKVGKSLRICQR